MSARMYPLVSAAILCLSIAAHADIVEVIVSTDIVPGDFEIGTDSVFGVDPSTFTFSITIEVDNSAGVDMGSAGPDFVHDVWGYNMVSAKATFGDRTAIEAPGRERPPRSACKYQGDCRRVFDQGIAH